MSYWPVFFCWLLLVWWTFSTYHRTRQKVGQNPKKKTKRAQEESNNKRRVSESLYKKKNVCFFLSFPTGRVVRHLKQGPRNTNRSSKNGRSGFVRRTDEWIESFTDFRLFLDFMVESFYYYIDLQRCFFYRFFPLVIFFKTKVGTSHKNKWNKMGFPSFFLCFFFVDVGLLPCGRMSERASRL